MMIVRFPTGVTIVYNDATWATRVDSYTDLYTAKDGRWVAQIPTQGCVLEIVPACRVYQAVDDNREIDGAARRAFDRRHLSHELLAHLKRELRRYDARTGRWR